MKQQYQEDLESVSDVSETMESDVVEVDQPKFQGNGHIRDHNEYGRPVGAPVRRIDRGWGLQFEDLTYTVVKKQKVDGEWKSTNIDLLQGISGEAIKGQLTGIMGPMGAGKSTLLDALAGRIVKGSLSGTVRLNGQRMTDSFMKRNSAYVLKTDLLFPLLTVSETLMFAAEMRLPSSMPHVEKVDRVQALLMQLGLEHCANTKVGDKREGLSGGEKRMVSIGVDIIHGPTLLFLDDPTSGLDSHSALTVVEKLFDIAGTSAGTSSTVVLTILKPTFRIQMMLSRAIVLARGKVVYQGAPEELGGYIEAFGRAIPRNVNNVEYFLDLINDLEKSEAGVHPLVQFQRDGSKSPKSKRSNPVTNMFSTITIHEDESEGFDHSLTRLRSPLTPGIKLAKITSWRYPPYESSCLSCYLGCGASLSRIPLAPKDTYFMAGTPTGFVSTTPRSRFRRGIRSPMEALGEGRSPGTPYSSVVEGSDHGGESSRDGSKTYQNRWAREVMILMGREFKNLIRAPELFLTKEIKALIIIAILASLFHNPKSDLGGLYQRLAFFAVLNVLIVLTAVDSLHFFIREKVVFIREIGSNAYRACAYSAASLFTYLPTYAIQAITYVLIGWFALHLHGGLKGFWILVLILFLYITAVNSFILFVAALVPNYFAGYAVVLLFTALSFLTSGYFIRSSQIPLYWVSLNVLSPMMYSFEAFLRNEFARGQCFSTAAILPSPGNLVNYSRNTTLPDYYGQDCYMSGEDVLAQFYVDEAVFPLWGSIIALAAWCFVYRLFRYITLVYYIRRQRK